MALPAHQTKHQNLLHYPFRTLSFSLSQSNDGESTGTALWLGAQCLAAFLADSTSPGPAMTTTTTTTNARRKPRAIELGSGVGLTALTLAAHGWSVLATDLPDVVSRVLAPNIARNTPSAEIPGSVHVRSLDWTVDPSKWTWHHPHYVTPPPPPSVEVSAPACVTESTAELTELDLGPPFDLILTADTIYHPDLFHPLLRTLRGLAFLSLSSSTICSTTSDGGTDTPVRSTRLHQPRLYIALEARDPALILSFFTLAREEYNLAKAVNVSATRLRRAMVRAGLAHWKREDWEGVEIWQVEFKFSVDDDGDVSVGGDNVSEMN